MNTSLKIACFLSLVITTALSAVIRTTGTQDNRLASPPNRKLNDENTVSYVTASYPYVLGGAGNQSYQSVSVNFDGTLDPASETSPKQQKIVYNVMHFPGFTNDPFNLYSLARAWDPYYGLRPPFNLHHPSNYMLGFSPYPNMGYAPTYPNMYQDPYKTGMYGGYGYGMYGMMSPYMLNPLHALPVPVQAPIAFTNNQAQEQPPAQNTKADEQPAEQIAKAKEQPQTQEAKVKAQPPAPKTQTEKPVPQTKVPSSKPEDKKQEPTSSPKPQPQKPDTKNKIKEETKEAANKITDPNKANPEEKKQEPTNNPLEEQQIADSIIDNNSLPRALIDEPVRSQSSSKEPEIDDEPSTLPVNLSSGTTLSSNLGSSFSGFNDTSEDQAYTDINRRR